MSRAGPLSYDALDGENFYRQAPRSRLPSAGRPAKRPGGSGTGLDALICVRPRSRTRPAARAIGSAGERLVHTEEVTGSIPVSPTRGSRSKDRFESHRICVGPKVGPT